MAKGELSKDKVINFNHTQGPHRVDQHGVLILSEPGLGSYCQAHSQVPGQPIGTPKIVSFVGVGNVPNQIVQAQDGGKFTPEVYGAITVAHELLHCCNVYHHGEDPNPSVTWTRDAPGTIWEGTRKIRVLSTSGQVISGAVTFPTLVGTTPTKKVELYVWQGLASGDVGCVMRYETGEAYILPGTPWDRWLLLPSEREYGSGLCTSPAATGTNLIPGRWGPCAKDRGNCAGQIRVNDFGVAPRRDR